MRVGPIVALTAALLGVAVPATAAAAPPVNAGTTSLPYSLTIAGSNGTASVNASVPAGAHPVRLRGHVASTYTGGGTIDTTVNNTTAASVPAAGGGDISVDLRAVAAGAPVAIGLLAHLQPHADCFSQDNSTASLTNVTIDYRYDTTTLPVTIADFLSSGVSAYTVIVAANPSPAAQSAALNAVAALSHTHPNPTRVTVATQATSAKATMANRHIVINETSSGTNSITVEGTTMTVTGSQTHLADAAASLGLANVANLTQTSTANVTATLPPPSPATVSLAKLGAGPVTLTGTGSQSATIAVNQPSFATPLSSARVRLLGTSSAIPAGAVARADVALNGTLMSSTDLGPRTGIDTTIDITATQMQRNNAVTVTLNYAPPSGACSPAPLPARLDINTITSQVQASPGKFGDPGFAQIPQALPSNVPVAFTDTAGPNALIQAANLIASFERGWPMQHTYTVTTYSNVERASTCALVIGTLPANSPMSQAAIISGNNGAITVASEEPLHMSGDMPLAYVQTFAVTDLTSIINVGTYTPSGSDPNTTAAVADTLTSYVNTSEQGWSVLTGSVVTETVNGPVNTLTLTVPARTDSLLTKLVVSAVVLLAVACAVAVWAFRRPRGPAPELPGQDN